MLNLGSQFNRTCDGISRRACLRIGTAGLFGLSLPRVLAAQDEIASSARQDINCIVLWMGGGPSNLDTFDMKPEAPSEYRGEFRPISANLAGLEVCEHLPQMARRMDKVCLLRGVTQEPAHSDHVAAIHYMMTGYPQRSDPSGQPINSTIYPSFGSVISRERGWRNSLPPYVLMARKGGVSYHGAGYMGAAYNPLTVGGDPNEANFSVQDVSIAEAIGVSRMERRRQMLAAVDRWQRETEQPTGDVADRNRFYQQAYDLITSPAAKRAFQLDEEPAALRDRYGRTRDGQSCLLARRLVEGGVRFVTVPVGSWDTHQDNFKRLKGELLPPLDQCWSALLDDLSERGMLPTPPLPRLPPPPPPQLPTPLPTPPPLK